VKGWGARKNGQVAFSEGACCRSNNEGNEEREPEAREKYDLGKRGGQKKTQGGCACGGASVACAKVIGKWGRLSIRGSAGRREEEEGKRKRGGQEYRGD